MVATTHFLRNVYMSERHIIEYIRKTFAPNMCQSSNIQFTHAIACFAAVSGCKKVSHCNNWNICVSFRFFACHLRYLVVMCCNAIYQLYGFFLDAFVSLYHSHIAVAQKRHSANYGLQFFVIVVQRNYFLFDVIAHFAHNKNIHISEQLFGCVE